MIKQLLIIQLSLALGLSVQTTVNSQKTVENLSAAYSGENNANHRYIVFAKKAEGEGYPEVARLFRAAAQAEAIHRQLHQTAIVALTGKPVTAPLDLVNIGTTWENLEAAIRGESSERDSMYPTFIMQAQMDGVPAALRSFTLAKNAETEHARLFQQALNQLGRRTNTDYYVCLVCGYTTTKVPQKNCPSCHNGAEKFVKPS